MIHSGWTTYRERCTELGRYLLENRSTVRATAQHFGISKSTVHKDLTVTLRKVDYTLYRRVKAILQINKEERHIRGGEATRKKYRGQSVRMDVRMDVQMDDQSQECQTSL